VGTGFSKKKFDWEGSSMRRRKTEDLQQSRRRTRGEPLVTLAVPPVTSSSPLPLCYQRFAWVLHTGLFSDPYLFFSPGSIGLIWFWF
jgi:hypothetical protein